MTTWRYCTHDVIEYGIVQLVHISDKRRGEESCGTCVRDRDDERARGREREAGQVRRTSGNCSLHNNTQSNTYPVTQCGIQGDTVTVM